MRVWYVEALGDQEEAIATRLAAEIDGSDMWQLQKRAMLGHEPCSDAAVGAPRNGGDDRLDLYLVYPSTGLDWNGRQQDINHARGVAVPESWINQCGWSTFLLVNSVRSFEGMKSTTAHELFHAFQFSFKLSSEYQWWMEASATWAQDLVYPELNIEQQRLETGGWALLGAPIGPLDRFQSGKHYQYGAYIWPFYLTHRPGGKPELVGEIWRAGEQKRPIQAMREMSDWQESFKQFALWLYNEQPVERLLDAGKRIEPLQQLAECWRPDCKLPPGNHELRITLNRLSLAYYLVERSGKEKDIKQLRFKLDDVSGQQAVGLQAIITLGDKEHPPISVGVVDWSDTAERTFCLEREDLREVVLVVSNSSIATPGQLSGKLVLEALEEPCPAQAGFVYETSASYELNRDDGDLKVSASASSSQLVSGDWEIGFQEQTADETRYVITSTNRIELEAKASLQGTRGDTAGSTHIRIAGSGVSHNPVRPGDDQYGSLARPLYPAESISRPPYSPGQLVLYERDGRHLYRVTIGLASIRADYTYQSHLEYDCGESRNTYDESYDNGTLVTEIKERGSPDCFSVGDRTWTEKAPNVFGAFVAYADRPNRVPGTSGPISGEYDPRTGVIEGENSFETASCEQAEPYDPIPIARLMRERSSTFDPDMREHGSCTLRYTLRWRFVLPGSGR